MVSLTQLATCEFAAEETARYSISHILIRKDGSVCATDGRAAAIIGPPEDSEEHPEEDALIWAEAAKRFLQVAAPQERLCTKVSVSTEEEAVIFEQKGAVSLRVDKSTSDKRRFPDMDSVIPKADGFAIDFYVSAERLARIVNFISKHSGDHDAAVRVCVQTNRNAVLELHAKGKHDEEMMFLLMPLSGPDRHISPKGRNLKFAIKE